LGSLLAVVTGCDNTGNNEDNSHDKPHNPNAAITVNTISPVSGGIGTKVVVTGSNFGNDPQKVKLFFNEKEALVMKVQDNAIYALTPRQPGEFSTIRVAIDNREGVLSNMNFRYFTKSSVTTVAGKLGDDTQVDGPALQSTFGRPVMVAATDDDLVFIVDDGWGRGKRTQRVGETE
jgi:hypothetical protein